MRLLLKMEIYAHQIKERIFCAHCCAGCEARWSSLCVIQKEANNNKQQTHHQEKMANNASVDMSFFPTSYADGQSSGGAYNSYPSTSNYMPQSTSGSYQTGFEDEPPLLEG